MTGFALPARRTVGCGLQCSAERSRRSRANTSRSPDGRPVVHAVLSARWGHRPAAASPDVDSARDMTLASKSEQGDASHVAAVLAATLHAAVAFLILLFSLWVLSRAFTAAGDLCDPLHESPNTVGGWTFSLVMVGVTALVGLWIRRRTGLSIVWPLAITAMTALPLLWLLLPAGNCGAA